MFWNKLSVKESFKDHESLKFGTPVCCAGQVIRGCVKRILGCCD